MAAAERDSRKRPHEENKIDHSFLEFEGVNTQADRKQIGDKDFAWLENVMPVGNGNLRAIYAPSAGLLASPLTGCYYMEEGNISNTDYMFMFCADGSAYQVNLSSYAVTTVGAAGTFSGAGTVIAQWKNERIVIVDPTNGFFDWDGTTLTTYKGTIASAVVNTAGANFTSAPTITPSGGTPTTAATFTGTIGVGLVTLVGGGTGYAVGDPLTVVGGTETVASTISVSAITTGGVISGLNLTTGGTYTVAPVNPAAVTGGHGAGATFTLNFGINAVTVATPGKGYVTDPTLVVTNGGASFTGTITGTNSLAVSAVTGQIEIGQAVYYPAGTLIGTITAGTSSPYTITTTANVGPVAMTSGGTGATLTANMAINTGGTTIAVYAGRVWVGNNRTVVFTAPDSYNDFNPADLGGSFIMTDSTLKSVITSLYSANNYLYIIGGSSVNIISNVTVTSPTYNTTTGAVITAGATVFSNTNISPSIGTRFGISVQSYFRTLAFVTDYGVIGMTGSTPQKMSDALDGVFPLIDFTQPVSGGLAVINGIICLCFLVQYKDPVAGTRPLFCIFFNGKWFFGSQLQGLTFVASASPISDVPSMYGTDGSQLYALFSNSTASINQTVITKLWNMGSSLIVKQVYKLGIETLSLPTITPAQAVLGVTIDSEDVGGQSYTFDDSNNLQFQNNQLQNINFVNNSGGLLQFVVFGYKFIRYDVTNFGNYIGLTIKSQSPGIIYNGFHLQYEARTVWQGTPW